MRAVPRSKKRRSRAELVRRRDARVERRASRRRRGVRNGDLPTMEEQAMVGAGIWVEFMDTVHRQARAIDKRRELEEAAAEVG